MADPFDLVPLDQQPSPPTTRYRPLGILIVLVLLAGVAIAVLKPDDSKKNPAALVRAASATTEGAGSWHFTATIDITVNGQQQPTMLSMSGDTDTATKSAIITMTGFGGEVEVRAVNGTSCVHYPSAALPEGKSWVCIDESDINATELAKSPSAGDVMQQLEFLNGLVGEPENLGQEDIDGVRVTHYGLTLDLTTLFEKMKEANKSIKNNGFVAALDAAQGLIDLSHIKGEVWLDDAGRARRFLFRIHLTLDNNVADEVVDMQFTQFGEPVAVELPPEDERVPLSEAPDVFNSPN